MPYAPVTIDKTWFIGELHLPGALGSSAADTSVQANLAWFIAKYQPEYLKKLMGEDLYDLYAAAIATQSHDAKWDTLADQIYNTTDKVSPVANYVYFHYRANDFTITVPTGQVKGNYENAVVVSSHKERKAWNDMVEQTAVIQDWIMDNLADYPEYEGEVFEKINILGI